jgi:hypothetical protein
MTKKTSKAKTERSTTRDLRAKNSAAVKGGSYDPGFTGGVRVATGDVNSGGKATIVAR